MSSNFPWLKDQHDFKLILLSFFLDHSLTSHQLKITLLIVDGVACFVFFFYLKKPGLEEPDLPSHF